MEDSDPLSLCEYFDEHNLNLLSQESLEIVKLFSWFVAVVNPDVYLEGRLKAIVSSRE
jgi:hypothetical protein